MLLPSWLRYAAPLQSPAPAARRRWSKPKATRWWRPVVEQLEGRLAPASLVGNATYSLSVEAFDGANLSTDEVSIPILRVPEFGFAIAQQGANESRGTIYTGSGGFFNYWPDGFDVAGYVSCASSMSLEGPGGVSFASGTLTPAQFTIEPGEGEHLRDPITLNFGATLGGWSTAPWSNTVGLISYSVLVNHNNTDTKVLEGSLDPAGNIFAHSPVIRVAAMIGDTVSLDVRYAGNLLMSSSEEWAFVSQRLDLSYGFSPASDPADIAVTSVTQLTKTTGKIDYEITGTDIDESFVLALYRSADRIFDDSDCLMWEEVMSGANATEGEHSYEYTLTETSPPDPTHPYVLAVADPGNVIDETDSHNNTDYYRKYLLGVVTHGFEGDFFRGGDPTIPEWLVTFANYLDGELYDQVITFAWAGMSPIPDTIVEAGVELARQVEAQAFLLGGENDVVDVHFIGHSRGAVVISQALINLEVMVEGSDNRSLLAGYKWMTMIDPHPARNREPGMYSVNPLVRGRNPGKVAELLYLAFQGRVKDPDVIVPSSVDRADVYYQQSEWWQQPITSKEYWLNLWGEVPVINQSSKPVNYTLVLGVNHATIVNWYRDSVLVFLLEDMQARSCPTVV